MRRHLREYPLGPRHLPGTPRRLRKRQSKCRGTCAGCANAKANAAELARPAQTPKQMPQDSRRLHKRQGKCRRTRAGCANAKANAAGLAQAAQTSRQMPREPQAGCAIKSVLIQHHGALGVAAQLVDHADILRQGAVERERRQTVEGEKTLVENVERAG